MFEKLPKTVRGMGLAFGAHEARLQSQAYPQLEWQRGRLADKLGFIVVVRLVEQRALRNRMPRTTASTPFQREGQVEPQDPMASSPTGLFLGRIVFSRTISTSHL